MSTIKVDELIDSLLTFEMGINDNHEKKNKSMAVKGDFEEDDEHVEYFCSM